jgi:hypothetical protein
MRLQDAPKKDVVAQAKLQARVAYCPKTPTRKDSSGSGGSPSRKSSMESCTTPDLMTRSLSRNSSRNGGTGERRSSWGTKSLGRSSGIRYEKPANIF